MSSSHATVTYTSMSSDNDVPSWGIPLMDAYESEHEAPKAAPQSPDQAPLSPLHAFEYPEYFAPSDDDLEPAKAQPLPTSVSHTVLSPGYSADYKPMENPEEEPSEEEEKEESLALAAFAPALADSTSPSKETEPFEEDEVAPTHPSPTSPYHIISFSHTRFRKAQKTVLTQPPLSPSIEARIEAELDLLLHLAAPSCGSTLARGTRYRFMAALEANKRVAGLATSHRPNDLTILRARIASFERERGCFHDRATTIEWTIAIGHVQELERAREPEHQDGPQTLTVKMAPKKSGMSATTIKELITQRVTKALAAQDINRNSGNGNDNGSHDSGSGGGRTTHTACVNCTIECQVKYATCTLLSGALTWWNSYVRTVGHDAAYGMPCKTLMKMMTKNYCPRSKIKKLETELWNLIVKGTDVEGYTQRFQELILLCSRMVLGESDKVEKSIGGLPGSIQGYVMASKPTKLQEAIELARSLMDQKILTYATRQVENKRRMDNNSRNNHVQKLPYKRQNVARAYSPRHGEKREFTEGYGSLNMTMIFFRFPSLPLYDVEIHGSACDMEANGGVVWFRGFGDEEVHVVVTWSLGMHVFAKPHVTGQDVRISPTSVCTSMFFGVLKFTEETLYQKKTVTWYECGKQEKSGCPKLKNQGHRNATRNSEPRGRAYALGGGEPNTDSNVVTGINITGATRSYPGSFPQRGLNA
nr:reverse transcriptase domain-containing protein [Tanacetum cinerariifolium]